MLKITDTDRKYTQTRSHNILAVTGKCDRFNTIPWHHTLFFPSFFCYYSAVVQIIPNLLYGLFSATTFVYNLTINIVWLLCEGNKSKQRHNLFILYMFVVQNKIGKGKKQKLQCQIFYRGADKKIFIDFLFHKVEILSSNRR